MSPRVLLYFGGSFREEAVDDAFAIFEEQLEDEGKTVGIVEVESACDEDEAEADAIPQSTEDPGVHQEGSSSTGRFFEVAMVKGRSALTVSGSPGLAFEEMIISAWAFDFATVFSRGGTNVGKCDGGTTGCGSAGAGWPSLWYPIIMRPS